MKTVKGSDLIETLMSVSVGDEESSWHSYFLRLCEQIQGKILVDEEELQERYNQVRWGSDLEKIIEEILDGIKSREKQKEIENNWIYGFSQEQITKVWNAIKFVRHIENHLEKLFPNQNAKVICKICNKTIEEI